MKHSFPFIRAVIALLLALATSLGSIEALAADAKPVLLYSLYFNAKGENRYAANGAYSEVLKKLGESFQVRVHDQQLNADTLQDVSVVLISNPNDKASGANPPPAHCSAADVTELTRFVRDGGGVIVMANQENHNLEIDDFNGLMKAFGMRYVSNYTDAKKLTLPATAPIIGGLRWAYYTGDQLVLQPGHPAEPRAVAVNDLAQKPEKGPRDAAGILMAAATLGKGHFVAATDAGWITNDAMSGKGIGGVAIKEQDNWEIMSRITRWAAGLP
jgi:hypothetical protein